MEVRDLMIDNWVYVIDEDGNEEPLKIDLNDMCNIECDNSDMFKPIPLTEEIFLKSGFNQKYITDPQGEFSESLYWIDCFEVFYIIKDGIFFYQNGMEIIYLHHLQNLFYILKSKQLEIKF